jgi:hypothetical protein
MTVPNADQAVVPREKLTDDLLVLAHPVGGSNGISFWDQPPVGP